MGQKKRKIIVAVTGASGSVYARMLVGKLLETETVEVTVIVSDNGMAVMRYEDSDQWLKNSDVEYYDNRNFFSPPASGSSDYEAMVIIPCSMGTLGRIACGTSSDLIGRAADVMLKERRTLIAACREMPLSTIHLKKMTALSESGAIVLPLAPSFYSHPATIEALCATVIERILSLLKVDYPGYRWNPDLSE